MTQRIISTATDLDEWNEPEGFNTFEHDVSAEHTVDESVDSEESELVPDDAFRSGPMIALEQLVEVLEERQNPDQRRKSIPIDFSDRRKVVRRASDLKS